MKEEREYIVLLRQDKEWRLVTRETATKKHADSLAKTYKRHGYETKIVYIGDK